MIYGYARVSTQDQNLNTQLNALTSAGAEQLFQESASGGRWQRPELQKMLAQLQPGDVLMVWKLDRLSRSLKDLLTILEQLEGKGVGFRSLTEHVDTTTPAGRMMAQMVGAFAEFERAIIRERTLAGVQQARKAGRVWGRPKTLRPHQRAEILDAVGSGRLTQAQCARLFNVHRSTISRVLDGVNVAAPQEAQEGASGAR